MKDLTVLAVLNKMQQDIAATSKEAGPKGDKGDKGDSVKGDKGDKGDRGDQGIGINGHDGHDGDKGDKGDDGVGITDAEIAADGDLVFTLTDGSEIAVDMPEGAGGDTYIKSNGTAAGSSPAVRYVEVSDAIYAIEVNRLIVGTNIFGVDAGEDAVVTLGVVADSTKVVHIQNESDCYIVTLNYTT